MTPLRPRTASVRPACRARCPGASWRVALLLPVLAALAAADGEAPRGAPAADPWVLGVFAAGPESVIDGDTLRLPDGQPSVRVLGVDCEEIFKSERDREASAGDFPAYARSKRGTHPRPVKYGTPAGEEARRFVVELLRDVKQVRLERDRVGGRETDVYGRRLAHVILLKPDGEVNLARAVIRAGHSPYFVKYGRSERFDEIYRQAESEAQLAKRGIWDESGPPHYPDYGERLAWWRARAAQVERWRAGRDEPDHVTLGDADADRKLRERLGKHAVVFGLLAREIPVRGDDRRILLLGHMPRRGFALVIFSQEVYAALDMPALSSLYVTARGTVTLYKGRPQIVIDRPTQLSTK